MNIGKMLERLGERIGSGARNLLRSVLAVVVVLAVITIGELLPPVRAIDAYLKAHASLQQSLMVITILMSVAGALLLALAQFLPYPKPPPGITTEDEEAHSPPIKDVGGRRRPSRSFGGEASFADVKEAWRRRSWRYDGRWRILFVMMLGAIFTLFGVFGLIILISPPGLKFLMCLLLVYAIFRTALGISRA